MAASAVNTLSPCLSEGIRKFLPPLAQSGSRRSNLPRWKSSGFVGSFEIVCAALILIGLVTRLAAIHLLAGFRFF
jgi:uncharacterized membrane protein YphA (DoxX/SURF4 family)